MGSESMCAIRVPGAGKRQRSVVTEPARQPMNSTRSASSTSARVSTTPPFDPTTPRQFGCSSESAPWPLTVVATAMFRRSAKACRSASPPAKTTPPPQTSSGLAALRSASTMPSTAASLGAAGQAG